MPFSRAVDDAVLALLKGSAISAYANLYVAILTAQPSQNDGTGLVECSTGTWTNYARVSLGTLATAWSATGGTLPRSITNANAVNFGTIAATGTFTCTGFAVYDALTSGNFVGYGVFTNGNLVFNPTDLANFGVGALAFSQG